MKRILCVLLSAVLIVTAFSGCGKRKEGIKIALITMCAGGQYWTPCREGAEKAAAECGCTLDYLAPMVLDEALSIEQLNNAVAAGYDAVLFAAISPDSPIAALREADEAGVKIIYVDSPANYPCEVAYRTDGHKGGIVAAENMLNILAEKGITSGKIGIVSVSKAVRSSETRVEGFVEAFEGTGYELLEVQYCDGDTSKAQTICENFITQGVVGIFSSNEVSTVGSGNAIRASGKDVVGFGFDNSDAILNLVDAGYLDGVVYQKPEDMGYYGVKAAVDIIRNGADYKGEYIDTGVAVTLHQ